MSERVTTDFLLDGSEIAEEIAGEGVTSYVGPGLISEVSGTARSVYHADGLGSTRAMSDGSQVITESGIYDAYGNLAQDFPASSSPSFGYAGQHRYCTDATGLDYLKARYYDPTVGRFLSRDLIGYGGGLNLYAYAGGNPVNAIDPDGTFSIPSPIKWLCKLFPNLSFCKKIVKPLSNVLKCKEGFDCTKCAGDLLEAGNECRNHADDHMDEILAPPYYGNRLKWQIDCVNTVVKKHGHNTNVVDCLTKCAKIPIEWLGGTTPGKM